MPRTLGVGIIGASATRGWAKDSHIPAINGVDGLKLAAVAAGDEKKAQEAKEAFAAGAGYASGFDLIKDPAVDIVTVAVKVPDHRELVLAAIAAGKHVYCEWPLGKNISEAEEMSGAATAAGVRTAIGLQMRSSGAVLNARKALQEKRIGRTLSARIVSNTAAFGPDVEPAMQFGEDPANGVTLISIQGAHTFDLAMTVLGEVKSMSAMTSTQYPQVRIGDDPTLKPRSTSDHVLLMAKFISGVPVSIEVAGGRPKDAPTIFEVTGTERTLAIKGGAMRGVQSGRLNWFLDNEAQSVDESTVASLPDAAANVAGIYALLRDDILNGTATAPGFEHAVNLARFVDAVLASPPNYRLTNIGRPNN